MNKTLSTYIFPFLYSMLFGIMIVGCGTSLYDYTNVSAADHINNKRTIEVWTTNNFSDTDEEALNASLNEWNNVFNGQMELKTVGTISSVSFEDWRDKYSEIRKTGDGWLLIKLNSEHELVRDEVTNGTIAFVPRLGAPVMFILEDKIGTKNIKTILMHEMGHMLGAEHVNMNYTLMIPLYGFEQADCIDLITARQVAWMYELDIKHMNYCVVPEM